MGLRNFNPTSPGRRTYVAVDNEELSGAQPLKRLLRPITRRAGRNNSGRITVRHRGGGARRHGGRGRGRRRESNRARWRRRRCRGAPWCLAAALVALNVAMWS